MTNSVIIKQFPVSPDQFPFELSNGYSNIICRCETENEARSAAIGFEAGFSAVKNLIGNGIRYTGKVEKAS